MLHARPWLWALIPLAIAPVALACTWRRAGQGGTVRPPQLSRRLRPRPPDDCPHGRLTAPPPAGRGKKKRP